METFALLWQTACWTRFLGNKSYPTPDPHTPFLAAFATLLPPTKAWRAEKGLTRLRITPLTRHWVANFSLFPRSDALSFESSDSQQMVPRDNIAVSSWRRLSTGNNAGRTSRLFPKWSKPNFARSLKLLTRYTEARIYLASNFISLFLYQNSFILIISFILHSMFYSLFCIKINTLNLLFLMFVFLAWCNINNIRMMIILEWQSEIAEIK